MRRPPVLVGAQRLSPGLSRGTAAELWAELPTAFARTVFPLGEQPYAALFYRRAGESSAVVDCSSLPRAMGCEMAWWLHALTVGGERVTAAAVRMWTRLVAELNQARARRGQSGIESFLDLPLADWMAAARLAYAAGTGQLPPPRFAHAYEPMLRRLHGALVARCDPAQWWRADVWDPTHDPRIDRLVGGFAFCWDAQDPAERPAVPEYCRETPADRVPFFKNPVSSMINTPSVSPSCCTT